MKIKFIVLTLFTLILTSCGGGSRGTGDLDIEGKALTSQNLPISNARVTFTATGDSAFTDVNGQFIIKTQAIDGAADFLIDTGGQSVISSGGTLTSDIQAIEVEIKIEIENGKPVRASQKVTVKNKREDNDESNSGGAGSGDDDNNGNGSDDGGNGSDDNSGNGNDGNSGNGEIDDDSDGNDDGNNSGGNHNDGGGSDDSSDEDSGSGVSNPDEGSGNDNQEENHDSRVETSGTISALTDSTVTVNGRTFTANSETDFDKRQSLLDFNVGEYVEIKGEVVSGVLIANEIKFKN